MDGTVSSVWIAPEGGARMARADAVEAVSGRGLRGDRYFRASGYYSGVDGCQVTLVSADALAAVANEHGIDLSDGRHRRNLVVDGLDVEDLLETRFRVGEAVLEGTRPRPPCAHLAELAGVSAVVDALGGGRAGICADVVETGSVAAGDELAVLAQLRVDPEELIGTIRRRHE